MRLFVLFFISVFSLSAAAEVIRDIYDVRVPVEARSNTELRRAAVEGLETVLIRVSGERHMVGNEVIGNALNRADSFLSQYQYTQQADERTPAGAEPQIYLQMSFLGGQIEQLLQRAGLPIWSSNRPRLLIWLVADDATGRHFVTPDSHPELVAGLKRQARKRGLLLSFPLMDLQDSFNLTPDQMWSMDIPSIRQATERYDANHSLVGRLSQLSSGSWVGNLLYSSDLGDQFWDVRGANAEVVTLQPIDNVADQLAARYAVVTTTEGAQSVNVMIKGIQGFTDYARAATYLESIAIIDHANLVWLSDSQLVLNLISQGSLQKVEEFFALDRKMVLADPEPLNVPEFTRDDPADTVMNSDPEPVVSQEPEAEPAFLTKPLPGEEPELPVEQSAPTTVDMEPPPVEPVLKIHGYYRWQGSRG